MKNSKSKKKKKKKKKNSKSLKEIHLKLFQGHRSNLTHTALLEIPHRVSESLRDLVVLFCFGSDWIREKQNSCSGGLVTQLCLTLATHGLQPARLFCPWDSPGKNTGVGCHFLLQRIFLTQELNVDILHCRQILH